MMPRTGPLIAATSSSVELSSREPPRLNAASALYVVHRRQRCRPRADVVFGSPGLVGWRHRHNQAPKRNLALEFLGGPCGTLVILRSPVAVSGVRAQRGGEKSIGIGRQQFRRDDGSHRITHHVDTTNTEVVEESHGVLHKRLAIRSGVVRFSALPVASQVKGDHAVVLREILKYAGIEPVCLDVLRVAVNQQDGLTRALLDIAQPHAVRVKPFVLRNLRGRK